LQTPMNPFRAKGTPKALHDLYRCLSVSMPNRTLIYGIDIHNYKNAASANPDFAANAAVSHGYEPLRKAIKKYGKKISTYRYQIQEYHPAIAFSDEIEGPPHKHGQAMIGTEEVVDLTGVLLVFLGKGSPEQIARALQLAVYFELIEAALPAIQLYCNRNIGLDCSGFTGVYYGDPYYGKGSTGYRTLGTEVTRLEDVRQGSVMVWLNTNHIAVIDQVLPGGDGASPLKTLECMVAESTGSHMTDAGPLNGLNYTQYIFEKKASGFYVTRSVIGKKGTLVQQHPNVTIRNLP
jgi:hypothetical protein